MQHLKNIALYVVHDSIKHTSIFSALLPFKTGAFRSGKPVQPVLVKYPNRLDTVTWTWDQPHGALTVALLTLSRPLTRIHIQILPVYYPSKGTKGLVINNITQIF